MINHEGNVHVTRSIRVTMNMITWPLGFYCSLEDVHIYMHGGCSVLVNCNVPINVSYIVKRYNYLCDCNWHPTQSNVSLS